MAPASLRAALLQQGGTLAETVGDGPDGAAADLSAAPAPPTAGSGSPQLAASGPRAAGRRGEYELLLEMILEGSLLHYGTGRVVQTDDPDLALLLGDQLYALGLSRLAELGDLDAVAELADLISLVAKAHASGDRSLADQTWRAGAAAIGWGSNAAHASAKELARAGDPDATEALQQAADAAFAADGEVGK